MTTPDSVHAPSGTKFIAISGGGAHVCGLASTGAAYCWGWGGVGQLGNGRTDYVTTPDSVHAPAGTKFVSISAGPYHTCGVTTTGAAYCWGSGSYGQIGNGMTSEKVTTPALVHAPAGTRFVSISVGTFHTCGVTSTGMAYCWGIGEEGQLGNGTYSRTSTPSPVLNVTNFALVDPRVPVNGAGRPLPARTSFEMYALAGRAGREPERCTTVHA